MRLPQRKLRDGGVLIDLSFLRFSNPVQGEEGSDILDGDIATCSVQVCLERMGSKSAPRTPFFSGSKQEGWWLLLGDATSNTLLVAQKVRVGSHPFCAPRSASPASPGEPRHDRRPLPLPQERAL